MEHGFKMLAELIKESQLKTRTVTNDEEENHPETTIALFSKLPIKDSADLEYVEDRLHKERAAVYELDNYLSSMVTKGDVHLCAVILVKKVFWEGFLNRTNESTELLETKLMSVVVDNVKERFSKETVISVIRDYLVMFEQEEHKPVLKKVRKEENITFEILVDEGQEYLDEESSMQETRFVSTNGSFSSHKGLRVEMSEESELKGHKRRRSFNLFLDPISSREDLQAFEEHLRQDKDAVEEFQFYLDSITLGDIDSIARYLRSMFRSTFSTDFLAICRWATEQNLRVPVRNTLVSRLMVNNVKREFPHTEDSRVFATISQILRSQKKVQYGKSKTK